MTDESFMTTEEVLDYLHLNLKTVYRLIKAGKLPAVRVGRQWRFRKRDVDTWLATNATHLAESVAGPSNILIVDDEEAVRAVLTAALASEPRYSIEAAGDGATALQVLRSSAIDLLVTDLKMPGMDGLTLIREARRFRPELRVIIITGVPSEASAIEAINIGVSGYLPKPFRMTQVRELVARALAPS